jgi:hypothetical protein
MVSRSSSRVGLLLILLALVLVVFASLRTGLPKAAWAAGAVAAVGLLGSGGYLLFRGMRVEYVHRSGRPGQATVISVAQAGYGVVDEDRGGVRATYNLVLRVTVPGQPPYQAKVTETAAGARARQLRTGRTLPVRVDPRAASRVVVDWDRLTATMMGSLGAHGLSIPGILLPGAPADQPALVAPGPPPSPPPPPPLPPAVDPYTVPVSSAPVPPVMPYIPYSGVESPEELLSAVRQIGLPGTATIDAVVRAGTATDGRQNFVLGMWILAGLPAPLRVDNAPTAIDAQLAHKVVLGAQVPVRMALVGGTQATVLLWDLA